MSRLIVKNIPTNISESQLMKIFEKKGEVTDVKIIFKENKNRRFCFIGFKTEAQAQAAQKFFDKTFVHMSKISVDFAKTLDDASLPRPWSRHAVGSSAYTKKHGKESVPQENEEEEIEKKPKIDTPKSEKFKEFLSLMQQSNTAAMAWNDNIDKGEIDNPKARQKLLKEQKKLAKQQEEEQVQEETKVVQKQAKPDNKPIPITGVDEKRLYVTNIPYTCTEADIRDVFSKFGTIVSIKLPKTKGGSLSGFCFVQFAMSEEAMRAYVELDNKIVLGRIMHVRPAFGEDKKPEPVVVNEKSSYKKFKKQEMLERLDDTTSWNTLFLNPNTILEYVSEKYSLNKRDILAEDNEDMAVKMAQMETQIIKEVKDWLKSLKLNIDFLKVEKGECIRSTSTLFVKNLQFRVTEADIHDLFSRHGKVSQMYLAPNKALAIVKFSDEQSANNAFKQLSYYKYKGSLLYLEWAPKSMMNEDPVPEPAQDENTLNSVLYVKNLNFKTTEKSLTKFFSAYNIKKATVVKKENLSQGYGFIEFESPEMANKAIREQNGKILDDHAIQLTQSKPNKTQSESKKERVRLEPTNKLVLRNIPFEASAPELRKLVKQYGEVKKLRLPKKLDGAHRGFAFVEFVNVEEASNAFESLQQTHFYGRRLVIEYSREEEI